MRNRAEIKAEAKGLVRGGRVSPLVMTALLLVIGFMLDRLVDLIESGSLFYSYSYLRSYYAAITSGSYDQMLALAAASPQATALSTFLSILVSLIMTVLSAGYYIYCMGLRQGLEMPYSTLLDGFSVAGRLILCQIIMSVKIFLWSLLFVIPGIVAAYRYRFAYYNLLTDNSLSASGAIALSCQQTRGIKGELLLLDLSFIGWGLLSLLTLDILSIWLTPYMTLSDLAYFEDAQRRLGRSVYGGGDVPPQQDRPWEL